MQYQLELQKTVKTRYLEAKKEEITNKVPAKRCRGLQVRKKVPLMF